AAVETASQVSTVVEVECTDRNNPLLRRANKSVEHPCKTNKTGTLCVDFKKLCEVRAENALLGLYGPDFVRSERKENGKGAGNQKPTVSGGGADSTSQVTPDGQEASSSTTANGATGEQEPTQQPPASSTQEERIVVVFGEVTQDIYNKHCANDSADNSAVRINGETCSEVLESLKAKQKVPQPPATEDGQAPEGNDNADSTTTTPQSPDSTNTEAPTNTPSPSTEAPTEQKPGNADSSFSPVWMRAAAPLLIVAALVL
ncbi:uncharacterized protein TM35_000521210, partial [Trypanosoma theileri]